MKKGKVIVLIIGILFVIAAICFFVAQNEHLRMADDAARMGIRSNWPYYARMYGYAAYGFVVVAIP